ncbi:dynamin family protein [Heyndrickxia acidicola]|uniref:Dynamin family protein n=1 Tax=Heyndrickxia acidicola TaxID=209389 RepID=A0ABU6MIE5_9BACI|nr:dynamin family protein [Heyndrickxia acidicola]MED1204445.1 dynamin family protein [Heyndrickxia acidicola]
MTIEKQLINKTYFERFVEEAEGSHPVQILGNAYMEEQQKEMSDLSYIRYAQGEVYFHNRDYEAAIFKWENIRNELEPWAKKNMADAYLELNLLQTAEDVYKSVTSVNVDLNTEVSLQLFSIYIEQGKLDTAVREIKGTISLNPDYPNVTDIARSFFAEQKDWKNAVELAVNEALRTDSVQWFDTLKSYIDKGYTAELPPGYFDEVLLKLYDIDQIRFEQLVLSLWESYRQNGNYFAWIKGFNRLFMPLETNHYDSWNQLTKVYYDDYVAFISGSYLMRDLQDIIPDYLVNWLKISTASNALIASAAVLSWGELFEGSISLSSVQEAEKILMQSNEQIDVIGDALDLFDVLNIWAAKHDLSAGHRLEWIIQELADVNAKHALVAGASNSGQSAFINSVLGEDLLEMPSSTVIVLKNHEEAEMNEVTDSQINPISSLDDFDQITALNARNDAENALIEFKIPSAFLEENGAVLVDIPPFNENRRHRMELFDYLPMADSLLFILNPDTPLTDTECDLLLQVKERHPLLPVLFILNQTESTINEQEMLQVLEDTRSRAAAYFPNAKVVAYSSRNASSTQLLEITRFIQSQIHERYASQERANKVLYFVRKAISTILETRVKIENQLSDTIKWNKEMVSKINGAIHQVGDMEKEKNYVIKKSFRNIIEETKQELKDEIPKILRGSSEYITEDSDFRKIHLQLNEEMNKRVHVYLQETVLPKFYQSIQGWIASSNGELYQAQTYLEEMSESFNALYGEERIALECDFKILDDWRRDADRMTSGLHLEKVNILLRHTPSQILLKSAGKLFGSLGQNKAMLYTRYKRFVENEDYQEATASITDKFLQQFELFEQALARDITMFFRNSLNVLNQNVEQAKREITKDEDMLEKMNANPEVYRDPLTLFELRVRQYEWVAEMGKIIEYA